VLHKLIKALLGDQNEKYIRSLNSLIEKINKLESDYQQTLSEEDFPKKTQEFKNRLKNGEILENILPEAFALVKNACRRSIGRNWTVRGHEITWDMLPYDVQLIGGIALHQGKIAEMKTGEGKTLVATMPLYLNALTEQGSLLVTVNDYLAHRDSEWMSGIYNFLGMTVGVIYNQQDQEEKKKAYQCDIVYGTNNEFGFDYLRDNMAANLENVCQKHLNYAIIDEVDSILIDEARTPLIISSPAEESTEKYMQYAKLVKSLLENEDYNIDEKQKTAVLTETGIAKMEKLLGVENIYTEKGFVEVNHIEQALKAQAVYKLDVDYVVKDNEVMIVDEFTGRLMAGRRFSAGLHQAIEAKEGVPIKRESKTLATISFQNYFRLFKKLAGMTGTALTEAEEFHKIYNLDVIVIPTNKPVNRADLHDSIYKNEKAKFKAIAQKVKEIHGKNQPVLIGTISIEKSEKLSDLLRKEGLSHTVLNAKYHEKEAEIVSQAGQIGAITIATNMAGRGTDIKLGEGVRETGGLYIIGTERHESRRIDNQLRGRSGRQGDPGVSQFYVSMDDAIMRIFGGDKIKAIMERLNVPDDMPIENGVISHSIESAQKKVEGYNFDIRNHLVEYDDVMNRHREIIYAKRRLILDCQDIKNEIIVLFEKEAEAIVLGHTMGKADDEWNYKEIAETVSSLSGSTDNILSIEQIQGITDTEALIEKIKHYLWNDYQFKEKSLPDYSEANGSKILRDVEKMVYLHTIDQLWMDHITQMTELRSSVAFSGYGQRDPLVEYKTESYYLFEKLLQNFQSRTVQTLLKVNIIDKYVAKKMAHQPKTAATTNQSQIEGNLGNDPNTETETNAAKKPTVIKLGPETATQPTLNKIQKIGRNDPCPCGSGKKFKKCCGKNL